MKNRGRFFANSFAKYHQLARIRQQRLRTFIPIGRMRNETQHARPRQFARNRRRGLRRHIVIRDNFRIAKYNAQKSGGLLDGATG